LAKEKGRGDKEVKDRLDSDAPDQNLSQSESVTAAARKENRDEK
jgi:hypothetical protein